MGWDEDNRVVSVRENGQDLSRALYDGAGERRVHLRRVAGDASSRGSAFLNIANGAP
ncbi:hypothetical protein [Sorangium cellulosum]|uniref:hypothetical protein n=1 Tax=Sorangium cellulosum TaxID=56 RepID=UPI0016515C01|nr:hypothetical protein [Sorangium cellulosum]